MTRTSWKPYYRAFCLVLLSIVALCFICNSIGRCGHHDDDDHNNKATTTTAARQKVEGQEEQESYRVSPATFKDDHEDSYESIFLNIPDPQSTRSNLGFITSEPHVAGTSGDYTMANFVLQAMEQAGVPNVSIFELNVSLNYPDMTVPSKVILWKKSSKQQHDPHDIGDDTTDDVSNTILYQAKLSEDILPDDDTSDTIWRNHTFHGYSPSGHVTNTPMVYANYGRPQDFDALEQAGISVNQTVVIVRYGKCFRGLKVRNAQQRGAKAVLIYSDPADDGYGQGTVYPDGPWRSASSVQRGSVQFNSQCAGDPQRADDRYPQTAAQDLCGVSSSQDLIPNIPSLPLSYEDAIPLLQHMGGPLAVDIGGAEYVGGITNITYRVGPSTDAVLEVQVTNHQGIYSIPNVIGSIPGRLPPEKDMPILLGNHRDAWVYGAADPNSGTASLLEVAKGLGTLYRDYNWRPLRSIYLLSWSGEEYGLLGSTGWAELNQQEPFIQRALGYLNVDTVVSGNYLEASASPSLTTLWKQVLKDLSSSSSPAEEEDKDSNNNSSSSSSTTILKGLENAPFGTLVDANTNWKWRSLSNEETETATTAIDQDPTNDIDPTITTVKNDDSNHTALEGPVIGILGSGSDYTVFLDHLGIPSLDFHFDQRPGITYGQYHSIYDSFAWMDQFGGTQDNPGSSFVVMAFAAKIWGLLAMRLASSPIVPLDHIAQGVALSQYTKAIEEQNQQHQQQLDLKQLQDAVELYQQAAASLHVFCSYRKHTKDKKDDEIFQQDNSDEFSLSTTTTTLQEDDEQVVLNDVVSICNEKLGLTERYFLINNNNNDNRKKGGLPGRPWFRHVLQAPGMDLGYAAEAFPGIQQAIHDKDWNLAQDQVLVAAEQIQQAAMHLKVE